VSSFAQAVSKWLASARTTAMTIDALPRTDGMRRSDAEDVVREDSESFMTFGLRGE
jgi:hypothetical protein